MKKSRALLVASLGLFGLCSSPWVRAAQPVVMRELGFKTDALPAYVSELKVLQALYTKHGLDVRIDAFRGTFAGTSAGDIAVQILVRNMTALAKMDEMTTTEPDLVAEMKKISGLGKLILKALHKKLSPAEEGNLASSASLPVRAAAPAVMRINVIQTDDVPAYVREVDVLRSLYNKRGLDFKMDAYQNYAGLMVDEVFIETLSPSLADLAKMDDTSRTQPDIAAQLKKIAAMHKTVYEGIYEKLTP